MLKVVQSSSSPLKKQLKLLTSSKAVTKSVLTIVGPAGEEAVDAVEVKAEEVAEVEVEVEVAVEAAEVDHESRSRVPDLHVNVVAVTNLPQSLPPKGTQCHLSPSLVQKPRFSNPHHNLYYVLYSYLFIFTTTSDGANTSKLG